MRKNHLIASPSCVFSPFQFLNLNLKHDFLSPLKSSDTWIIFLSKVAESHLLCLKPSHEQILRVTLQAGFPNLRSNCPSMGRHSCCYKQKLRKGLWSPEEDEKLFNHITKFGVGCWSAVPKQAGIFLSLPPPHSTVPLLSV